MNLGEASSSAARPSKVAKGGHGVVGKDGLPRKVVLTPRGLEKPKDVEKPSSSKDLKKSNKMDLEKSKSKDLETSNSAKDLEKSNNTKDLKKSKVAEERGLHGPEVSAEGLEKLLGEIGEIVDKPLVIVNWHYTLVQDDQTVKQRDLDALELLLGKADVLILSYIGSKKRVAEVPIQVRELVPFYT